MPAKQFSQIKYLKTILVLFLLSPVSIYCQKHNNADNRQNQSLLDSINTIYGSDDLLINGRRYEPLHVQASGNPYLFENDWRRGTLYIKGRIFNNVHCKYNIEKDKVVINTILHSGVPVQLIINNEYLDSFIIENHSFINVAVLKTDKETAGYYEQIFNGDFKFLKKHNKTFLNKYNDLEPYGSYSKIRTEYYLYYNSRLFKVFSKKSFLKYFKPYKKEIKKFIRKNRIKYKKASNQDLNKLMIFCNKLKLTPG